MIFILKYWKLIAISALIVGIGVLSGLYLQEKIQREIAEENLWQSQLTNASLTLSPTQLKKILSESETRTAKHVDSLLKANKISVKSVNEIHNVTNTYRDTSIVNLQIPVAGGSKLVEVGDKCWGFSGEWKDDALTITEKRSDVEIDLVDYAKPKKFLFIRFGWKKPEMKAFSDCGSATVRSYKRLKN